MEGIFSLSDVLLVTRRVYSPRLTIYCFHGGYILRDPIRAELSPPGWGERTTARESIGNSRGGMPAHAQSTTEVIDKADGAAAGVSGTAIFKNLKIAITIGSQLRV